MKISFRQGIIRYQQDRNGLPTFLKKNDLGSTIDFVAFNEPMILTFAYKKSNYLHEESLSVTRAWKGFKTGVNYWLYIDIDLVTAARTFGSTVVEPTYALTAPARPAEDMHWFDVANTTMKVWNGTAWIERARVFVAKYENGSIISAQKTGSQVANNTVNEAGFIIFGADGNPVRQNQTRKTFDFATTSTIFSTVTAKAINVSLDAICMPVRASEPLPAFRMITRDAEEFAVPSILLADCSIRGRHAVGMVQESFYDGETGIITQQGYITNEQWNFTDVPGTLLFLGTGGEITTAPAQKGFMQRLGEIVTKNTIYLNIQPASKYVDSFTADYNNVVPLVIDKVTGQTMLAPDYYFSGIDEISDILKDASKLPVTALGGPTYRLEEWTANFLAEDDDLDRRLRALENAPPLDLDIDYIREMPMPITVGGADVGTTFNGTVQDALDKVLYPYGVPKFNSFAIRGASTTLEVGATFAGGVKTFDWTTSNPSNIATRTIAIRDTSAGTLIAEGLENNGSTTATLQDIKKTVPGINTWTISAASTETGTFSRAFSIEWRWKIYYGNSDFETLLGDDILELDSSSLATTAVGTYVLPAGEYKWLCYPSSFPTMKSFKDVATGLNVAINDPIEVSVTSAQGITQKYKCHRTFNKLGGALTMAVS